MNRALEFDDLYRIPSLSDPQLSPGGSRVAFVVTRADRDADEHHSTIWFVTTNGDDVAGQFTAGPHDGAPRWSPDGRFLAFVRARDDDAPQLFVLSTTGGEPHAVTDEPGGVGSPAWSPTGDRLAYLVTVGADDLDDDAPVVIRRLNAKADGTGLLKGRHQHLAVVEVTDAASAGTSTRLTSGDWSVAGPVAWSPDGKQLAFCAATDPDADLDLISHVFVVDALGGVPRRVTDQDGEAAAPTFTPAGDTLVFAGRSEIGVGHAQLFAVDTGGGIPRLVTPGFDRNVMVGAPAYPGARPAISADGDTVVFCARNRGCTHAYAVPLAGGGPAKIVGRHDTVVSGLSMATDRIAYIESDTRSSGEVCVANVDGSGARRLTSMVAEALTGVELLEPAARHFAAPDGVELHGWVTRGPTPNGALLLDVHGGPHNAWSPVFDGMHLYHQVLAAQGWTILTVNPRGSDGYGESFFTALRADGWGHADAADFLAAIDTLIAGDGIDRDRVAVTGYSYGGYMANWLTARTDRFAAAVSGGCVTNLMSMSAADLGPMLDAHELGATPWDDPERLLRSSPITYATAVTAPTLILHGEDDQRCPVGQAEEWFVALRSRRVEVELVRYPGASHEFILSGRPSHRVDYGRRVVEWVTRHVT